MKKVKWAVVGAAGLAGRHVISHGIQAAANCELVGVQSRTPEHARREGAQHRVPGFASAEKMLRQTDADALYIATPPAAHLTDVELAVRHGKHVLCEKPLAVSVTDAQAIVAACRNGGVKLGVNFNYRVHPLHQQMQAMIRQGCIGKVVSARCQFGQDLPPAPDAFRQSLALGGGGAFADTGNHAADLLEYIMDRHTAGVFGIRKNTIHPYAAEDTCGALLDFKEGGLGIVDAYFCCPIHTLRNDLEINGTLGTLYTQNTLQMETRGRLILKTSNETRIFKCPPADMYQTVFERTAKAMIDGTALPASGEDGLHSQKVIDAVYRSSKTGRKIMVD